MSRKRRHAR